VTTESTPDLTPALPIPTDEALELLGAGVLTVEGRITTASNATLYCRVEADGVAAACVYKPIAGERPLWDFPDGTLAERERAAFLVSVATGWDLVPATVLRDGPFGTGMVQIWIDHDDSLDVVDVINSGRSVGLQRMAVFDAVINNSDRKVSHVLPAEADHFFGVDHGVSFAVQDKLRTVLWQWAGEPLTVEARAMVARLDEALSGDLSVGLEELLTRREVAATRERVRTLLKRETFPMPPTDWPAVPYPPY